MMVLYGYWPQLYGTVQCYTAGGRIIISCTKPLRGSFLAAILCPVISCDALSSPWMDY
jgi:hypothetical protein